MRIDLRQRTPSRHTRLALALVTVCVIATAGCAASISAPRDAGALGTIERLGAVQIPPAPGPPSPLPAYPGHPQILAIGAPVAAALSGTSATVTALGPQLDLPTNSARPLDHAEATITVRASDIAGDLALRPDDFRARDDHGRDVPLRPTGATRDPGHRDATLRLTGAFHTGSAQLTWRPRSAPLALWTFTIELD